MHDYVVVGGGSAGCVVARRLSDDPQCRVVLLEAGPPKHHDVLVRSPGTHPALMRSPLDWSFYTEAQPQLNRRRMFWPRGKVLGGTGSLNAMVYIRGHRENYDEWRDLGNPGWGFADVLPYFTRSEDNVRGQSDYHGAGGLMRVSDHEERSALSEAFIQSAAKRCGVAVTNDFNGAAQEGAGYYQATTRARRRASTATEFLDPVSRRRPNLEVLTEAHVIDIAVENGRARGVRCIVRGREQLITAAKEVILCAGAIGSPQILLLSGIGPADELRAVGVKVVHDLPGVGKNLQDHLVASVVFDTVSPAVQPLTLPGVLWSTFVYAMTRSGPFASAPMQAGAFVRSTPAAPRPDLQYHLLASGVADPNTDEGRKLPVGRLFSILPCLLYPRSTGEIRIESADPRRAPSIDPRYFSAEEDLELLVRGVEQTREIAATAPLAGFVGRERMPGVGHNTRETLRDALRRSASSLFHPVGSCKMGTDPDAVVDPQLRVRGVEGLRVADASIMPRIVGGNVNAPVIMIAEKASDMIRAT